MRPAWSEPFDPCTTPVPFQLPPVIDERWAWSDSAGEGVKVAIVDTGVEAEHDDVRGVAGGISVRVDSETDELIFEHDHGDRAGHGTACAGIVRAIAPQADLYSVRVLGSRFTSKVAAMAAGLRWCVDNGMDVVNVSLGTTRREYMGLLHEVADDAYFRGMAVVAAANNLPETSFPSHSASVFSVAAHSRPDPETIYYNPAPPVEFGARGIEVDVAWIGNSRIRATGNSFAAPHLAGLIARIRAKHPGMTPFQLKTVLVAVAKNPSSHE